ncbi:MAG: ATP-binding protein [Pirellulales bacterium]
MSTSETTYPNDGLVYPNDKRPARLNTSGFILLHLVIVTGFVAIGPWVLKSNWNSSSDFHSCIEIIGSFIAIAAGITCLVYFFGLKNRFYLIVGLGFFISGSEDLVHGILSFTRLFSDTGVDFSRFVPGTYVTGRLILASMTIAAPLLEQVIPKSKSIRREAAVFSNFAILIGGSATILAFSIPLPKFIYAENIITRPVDFFSAILFLIAFLLVWKRYCVTKDIFTATLLTSLLFNLCGQIYMSFSKQLFDAAFDLAHLANVFSYLMPLLGIAFQGLEEMRKTQAELSRRLQQEERLQITQFFVDRATEMILWLDSESRVYYANESASTLLGYSNKEMIGKSILAFCPEWSEMGSLRKPDHLETEDSLNFVLGFCHKNGNVIPVEVSISQLMYPHGHNYYCISGRDMHERTRAIATLREARATAEIATKTKSEFLATMSHEIRTPLTAILGYADALRQFGEIKKAPSNRIKMLSSIKRNGNFLLDLINDLLDLSQIEAGRLDLNKSHCSPLTLVQEVVANLLERAHSAELTLSVVCSTPIPHQIFMDSKRFRQILTNLVGNAIKFTREGRVTVRLAIQCPNSNSAFLVVAVEDSGIGIPTNKQVDIFKPFTRCRDEQLSHVGGTGLGLSICQKLVSAGGGEIMLKSESGKGSVFTFTVPFAPSSPMWQPDTSNLAIKLTDEEKLPIPKVNLAKVRILVVEDTPDTQELLALFLQDAGAYVRLASNGLEGVTEAVEAKRSGSPYDLILMDMRLPGLDGYAATGRLRNEGLRCPIIALTAYAMKDDKQTCLDAGCNAYLTKPLDLCVLFETIEQLLPEITCQIPQDPEGLLQPFISEKVADSQFKPLLEKYLSRLPGMLDQLQMARHGEELDELCTVVHRLRGTAANYGFPQITAIADNCETALRSHPTSQHHLNKSLDLLESLVSMAIETQNNEDQS